jgi:hypothetical protein
MDVAAGEKLRFSSSRKAWIAGAAVTLACLVAAPSAHAAFSVGGTAAPTNPTSGANSNFNINVNFNSPASAAESVKDLIIHLPPGLVGDPTSTPLCTVAQLNNDNCPNKSQLGTVSTNVTVGGLLPQTINGDLYNLVPQPGEPARFGIVLRPLDDVLPKTILQSAARLRKSDFGLDSVVNNIPNDADGVPIHINSQTLTLFGEAPTGKPFLRNPTSCGTHTTGFDATNHNGETASDTSTFTLSGCQNLPFSPTLIAHLGSPGHTAATTKPPLTTIIEQDDGEAGLERAEVILPQGVSANAAALGNQCPIAQFRASTCPRNTIVGEAVAQSPLLTVPLTGDVVIVEPPSAGLPNLGVDLKGPLAIQLLGSFVAGPGNVFEGLPDIPLSRFELTFTQDRLVLATRDLCEPPTPAFGTDFTGHNGKKQRGPVEAGVAGCTPSAEVKLTKAKSKHPRMKMKVKGGGGSFSKVKVKLPRQLKFAKKKKFKRGTKATGDGGKLGKKALKRKTRKLKVNAGEEGTQMLDIKAKKKALKRVKRIKKGKELRFPTTVEDVGGFETKLTPVAQAQG